MKYFLAQLNSESLTELRENVAEFEAFQDQTLPTRRQLYLTALHAGIPFIGFGFLDNFLMILGGKQLNINLEFTGFRLWRLPPLAIPSQIVGVFSALNILNTWRGGLTLNV